MPDVITFFAPKGGVGRTTATTVAASALVEAGKRVVVFDMADPYLVDPVSDPTTSNSPGTRLKVWAERVERDGIQSDALKVETIRNFESLITFSVGAEYEQVDYILVDTPGRSTDLIDKVLKRSSLIIAPATNGIEAALISHSLDRYGLQTVPVYGLVNRSETREDEQSVRATFNNIPVFKTKLPARDLFRRQIHEAHLFSMDASAWDDHAALRDARKFAEELMYLTNEANTAYLPPDGYEVSMPLAEGHALAHWQALLKQNPAWAE